MSSEYLREIFCRGVWRLLLDDIGLVSSHYVFDLERGCCDVLDPAQHSLKRWIQRKERT